MVLRDLVKRGCEIVCDFIGFFACYRLPVIAALPVIAGDA
jgi:hypothetical protein